MIQSQSDLFIPKLESLNLQPLSSGHGISPSQKGHQQHCHVEDASFPKKKKSPFSGEIRYLEPENYETIEGFLQALK